MKKCELCQLPARLHCQSDKASLCAECDLKVHNANFLVARHSRTLLCKTCQSPTPWKACGARLGRTETECEKCVDGIEEEIGGVFDDGSVEEDERSDWEDDECEDDDVEEEEGENQVIPCSSFCSTATSFSSTVSQSKTTSGNKRMREMTS